MRSRRGHPRSHCPVNFALEVFGDPWTLLVVRDAIYFGKRRFGEFLDSEEKIATNILADRLERLVRHGILRRKAAGEGREGPVYEPTEKGLSLLPVLMEIAVWSVRHDAGSGAPPAIIRRIRNDREGFIKSIRKRVRAGLPGFELEDFGSKSKA
jgi:DNA-binding HxlR family transcriptional regulator